jgi:TRAP-type C4-dicarboxylate transport system permease small subunit
MRRALDAVYGASGVLAGLFLVAIAVVIVAQIGARLAGLPLPGADDVAGYCLAATSFLGLAATFRRGEHIRVALLVDHVPAVLRRPLELWCLAVAGALSGYFTWYTAEMIWFSWTFNDVSQGLLPIPLWIPQSAMGLGLAVLFVALVDDLVVVLAGRPAAYRGAGRGPAPTFER